MKRLFAARLPVGSIFAVSLGAAFSFTTAIAQVPDAAAPAVPAPAAPAAKSNGSPADGTKFLGKDVPIFDPSSEIVTWDGHSWNLNNNRIFEERFEKNLNAPEETP